jgi:UDP-N-acetylmuramate dehydrogenase
MIAPPFAVEARALLGEARFRAEVPLAPFTSFRVGGPAEWFADPSTEGEMVALVQLAAAAAVPIVVLGGGTNLLVADAGVRGLVIRPRLMRIAAGERGNSAAAVTAEAGVTLNGLVRWMVGRGFAAIEEWAGTPGTVGGAVYGNAHWQGRNIGDTLETVRLLAVSGDVSTVPRDEMGFGYDTSRLQQSGEIVLAAVFTAAAGLPDDLRARARASLAYRKQTQPLASPSAGCIFQNPDPAHVPLPDGLPASAGALVDRAGLKGRRIGGAIISPTHANFVVSDGTATARDIHEIIELARRTVRERFGVLLRDEIVSIGSFHHG